MIRGAKEWHQWSAGNGLEENLKKQQLICCEAAKPALLLALVAEGGSNSYRPSR